MFKKTRDFTSPETIKKIDRVVKLIELFDTIYEETMGKGNITVNSLSPTKQNFISGLEDGINISIAEEIIQSYSELNSFGYVSCEPHKDFRRKADAIICFYLVLAGISNVNVRYTEIPLASDGYSYWICIQTENKNFKFKILKPKTSQDEEVLGIVNTLLAEFGKDERVWIRKSDPNGAFFCYPLAEEQPGEEWYAPFTFPAK